MKLLWSFLALIVPATSFAAEAVPPPRLGSLADRILFLFALWLLIVVLLIVLRWKISLADTLFRMMPQAKKAQSKEAKEGCSHQAVSPRMSEGESRDIQNPAV
jgi:hypothetical protein